MSAETERMHALSGTVVEYGTGVPVIGAAVQLGDDYLWTTTDLDGNFSIEKVQAGTYMLEVSCLGYVTAYIEVDIRKDIGNAELRAGMKQTSILQKRTFHFHNF